MAEIERRQLSPKELTAFMRDYDFVKWIKVLDQREEEAQRSGRYKQLPPPAKLQEKNLG